MNESVNSIYWEAPEHVHIEKTGDWYWIVSIIAIAGAVANTILSNNVLFSLVILLGAGTMMLVGYRKPRILSYEVSTRGIRVHDQLYPYATLESFSLDEEHPHGAHLILKSKKMFAPLMVLPIPEEYIHEIDTLIGERLPEEHMNEPLSYRIMEALGF